MQTEINNNPIPGPNCNPALVRFVASIAAKFSPTAKSSLKRLRARLDEHISWHAGRPRRREIRQCCNALRRAASRNGV
jgi:hypothetical protein